MTFRLINADCVEAMQAMAENSVDAIVTDPPYGLEFMGKEWDRLDGAKPNGYVETPRFVEHEGLGGYGRRPNFFVGGQRAQEWHHAWATEALRILKPGGHLLAFGGTRTYHRLACAIEDAGFEIRDCIAWMYGSGFPKSLDVSKAIDKAAGAEREVVGSKMGQPGYSLSPVVGSGVAMEGNVDGSLRNPEAEVAITAPATPEAQDWQGWGTALKPAFEPIVLARKPLAGTVAANVLEHGTGGLNIDGTRIGLGPDDDPTKMLPDQHGDSAGNFYRQGGRHGEVAELKAAGRWPANVILGHNADCEETGKTRQVKASRPASGPTLGQLGGNGIYGTAKGDGRAPANYADEEGTETVQVWRCTPGCAVAMLDEQTGESTSTGGRIGKKAQGSVANVPAGEFMAGDPGYGDTGGASRFFYCPKADREERNRGVEHLERKAKSPGYRNATGDPLVDRIHGIEAKNGNHHPTVKPVELMRWLCRLITPKGGTVLDPFTGSGSTGVAAMREGFEFIGIEREAEYVEIARGRIIGDAPLFNQEAE